MPAISPVLVMPLPADAGDGLATARLRLRRYTMADVPSLVTLNADEDVMRYLGGVQSAEDTQAMLEGRILKYYGEHPGLGVWATELRETGEVIGFHLLNHIRGEAIIQVGYRLAKPYWGFGYATEMSVALLHYGFAQLELSSITGITHLGNQGSQQVLLKSGLHRVANRSFAHPAYAAEGDLACFERQASDWLAEYIAAPTDSKPAADGVPIQ